MLRTLFEVGGTPDPGTGDPAPPCTRLARLTRPHRPMEKGLSPRSRARLPTSVYRGGARGSGQLLAVGGGDGFLCGLDVGVYLICERQGR